MTSISKVTIKTKDNKQITLFNGYYKNGVCYGYDRYGRLKSIDIDNIKSKKLRWI